MLFSSSEKTISLLFCCLLNTIVCFMMVRMHVSVGIEFNSCAACFLKFNNLICRPGIGFSKWIASNEQSTSVSHNSCHLSTKSYPQIRVSLQTSEFFNLRRVEFQLRERMLHNHVLKTSISSFVL